MSDTAERARHHEPEQFDFFVASLVPDLPLKDQRESMERPFLARSISVAAAVSRPWRAIQAFQARQSRENL